MKFDDTAFHKALVGTPGFSGFADHGARTPGPTLGDYMLPSGALGMATMQKIIGALGNDDIDDKIKKALDRLEGQANHQFPR